MIVSEIASNCDNIKADITNLSRECMSFKRVSTDTVFERNHSDHSSIMRIESILRSHILEYYKYSRTILITEEYKSILCR